MNSANDTDGQTGPPEIANRYRVRDSDDGSVEIYDSKNEDAWIRSDYTLELERPE